MMRALVLALVLCGCGSSTESTPDLAITGDMATSLPPNDMAGCMLCTAFITNCGTGLNCSKNSGGSLCCRAPGTTAAGQPCKKDEDCVADAVCLPDKLGIVQSRCYALCDGSHPCPSGSCNVFSGIQVCR